MNEETNENDERKSTQSKDDKERKISKNYNEDDVPRGSEIETTKNKPETETNSGKATATVGPLSISTVGDGLSLNFEQASLQATECVEEIAVPLTPQYKSFKKLEVIPSRTINMMTKLYNCVAFVALFLSAAVVIISRTVFSRSYQYPVGFGQEEGRTISITLYSHPSYFTIIDCVLSFIVFAYSLGLFIVFTIIILRERRNRILNEQVWVIMLLGCATIYLNPYEGTVRLLRDVLGKELPSLESGFSYIDFFISLRYLTFSIIYWLYLWFGAHSYRFLNRRVSIKDWHFYLFKLICISVYVVTKLWCLFKLRIIFSEVPFATLISFVLLYSSVGIWPLSAVLSVILITTLEFIITSLIALDIVITFRQLKKAEYTKHRTNILGYRFFLHQHLIFNLVYITTYIFLLFGLPIGIQVLQFLLYYPINPGKGSYFDIQYAPFGLHLCILAFITSEAYTNLPANTNFIAAIFPCFFDSATLSPIQLQPEPVVYRNREPPSLHNDDTLQIHPNCFVMQTNIELFNLSWFVYYYATRKEQKLNIDLSKDKLSIRHYLYDKETDTKAIVAESSDRIIFAFKGTSSSQNLVTDLKMNHRSLSSVIDSENRSPTNEGRQLFKFIRSKASFRHAKVHSGFAIAYNKIKNDVISITSLLLSEKMRPIFFTGHSLGGALATLSSLDVQLTLGMNPTKLSVSSFGSPRVGNNSFQQIYDEVIPTHWRFVAGGDLISRLPKLGYKHVGKKVVLTSTGQLFIDPSALEIIFWHSQPASIVHHRKACYLLALKLWCNNRGEYVPNLWPFPVSANDTRRFVATFRKPTSVPLTPNLSPTRAARTQASIEDRAARMQGYADAIDALNSSSATEHQTHGDTLVHGDISDHALHLWTRLGQTVLQKLQTLPFDDTLDSPISEALSSFPPSL